VSTITTAAREYASRPKDESFPSVEALVANAQYDKGLSMERAYNLKDLKVVPMLVGGLRSEATLRLESPKGQAKFTHWSFGQTCRMLGAPAAYLRDLPPAIAADCLNFGLQDSAAGTTANLLVKANGGEPIVRACTSDSYGRCWDADLYGSVAQQLMRNDDSWQLPPVWGGGVAGAYRGDRDSFLIVTNGGSIVNDPSAGQDGTMYRGVLIRNSEVGASSVVIETILYRYICGNHMLWGAAIDTRFRRRHVGSHVTRDVVREIGRIAITYAKSSVERDNAVIQALVSREIAHTKEGVIDELKKMGATKEQATAAYERCEQTEKVSPRSFWGAVQGLTRISQDSGYQDGRYELDQLAAKVLARGAKVAA
jgi:ribosomal protein S18 acetylase RimI-like enzyme